MKIKSMLSLVCICAGMANAQTVLSVDEAVRMASASEAKWASIHDPSIVYNPSDKNFYIVGTHMGVGRTSDLVNLNPLSNSNLYNTSYDQAFKSSPEHTVQVVRDGVTYTETLGSFDAGAFCATYAGITVGDRKPVSEAQWIAGDQWAPDLIYNKDMGKWCMYLSLNGDYWASVIVMLTSDSPAGPFTYQAPIVFGGFNGRTYLGKSVSYHDTDLELVLGEQATLPTRYNTSAWGNLWPNCIDPCVFYDDNSELWMAYGSWSGGIFMLKLDKNTGLRDYTCTYDLESYSGSAPNGAAYTGYVSDPYFGKVIAGGAYVSGEGAYIQKIGNYYYLFVTYGGLTANGGYEMRVFRSETPQGPFVDAAGNNARYTQYVLNYGPSARSDKGMKLIGAMNGWGSMTTGECAQGHNSAIVDEDGDAFVVYHTRFNNGTEGHQVRFRQLFVNENGWLVASPFRFTGKKTRQADIDSRRLFTADEVAGVYSLLIHPYRLNHSAMAEATPVKVTLAADGTISGDRTGTWSFTQEGKSYVDLTIGGVTYHGVALNQNVDGYTDMGAVCFTAVSDGGVPAWLYKLQPKAAVAGHYKALTDFFGPEGTKIKGDAPVEDNVEIAFEARNAATGVAEPETLSADGVFNPTDDGHAITVSARWNCGDYQMDFGPVTRATRGKNDDDRQLFYPESTTKDLTAGWWSNFSKSDYELAMGEEMEFQFYNYSSAQENWHNWALYGASATHGASGYKEYFGVRCDNWDNTTASNSGCSSNYDWDTFKTDMDGSLVKMLVSYQTSGQFKMEADITTAAGKAYKYSYSKNISGKPARLTLFFVNEKSYIDGSSLGVAAPVFDADAAADDRMYDIYGRPVAPSYKGVVIQKGRKFILR